MNIRPMELSDLDHVATLEAESFPNPWSRRMLYQDFARNPRARFMIAEDGNRLIGYVGIWLRDNEVHITTLAVDPDHRRQGVATRLLKRILQAQRAHERSVTLEVRESNEAAQQLYRKLGFEVEGRRERYYSDNQEDALIMRWNPETQESISHGNTR